MLASSDRLLGKKHPLPIVAHCFLSFSRFQTDTRNVAWLMCGVPANTQPTMEVGTYSAGIYYFVVATEQQMTGHCQKFVKLEEGQFQGSVQMDESSCDGRPLFSGIDEHSLQNNPFHSLTT
jgi:hypothetical protein